MVSQAEAFRKMANDLGLGAEFAALLAFCEGIAEAIDSNPKSPGLWGEYRMALERLLLAGEADDGEASVLELMHSSLGNTEEPRKKDARSGARRGSGAARKPADAVATADSGRRSRAS